jgi:hemolysin D
VSIVSNGTGSASSATPAPRAIIDYDFESVLAAPPRQRLVLWLMVGLIVAAAITLSVARVDIVVSANGKIVTTDSEIVVQPLEASIVRSVAVRMGDKVKAGDILATLDPTFNDADQMQVAAKLGYLQAKYDRLEAELASRDYEPANANADQEAQRDVFRKRRQEYAAKLDAAQHKVDQLEADRTAHRVAAAGLQQQIKLVSEQETMYQTLVAKNLASKLKLLDTTQRRVEAQTQLDNNLGEQQKLKEQIASATADRNAFVEEWRRKTAEDFADARSERDANAAARSKAQHRRELSEMVAPVDATVLDVANRRARSCAKRSR